MNHIKNAVKCIRSRGRAVRKEQTGQGNCEPCRNISLAHHERPDHWRERPERRDRRVSRVRPPELSLLRV